MQSKRTGLGAVTANLDLLMEPGTGPSKHGELEMTKLDLKPGTTLKIKGRIADEADGFVINLGHGTDKLGLHFNPRFKESTIVCNTRDGNWGKEHRDSHLCFSPGSQTKVTLAFHSDEFKVELPDGYELTFPNRLGYSHLSYLCVKGGLQVSSLKLN
ncbi:galectin-2 isoform X2 [Marmota monax]|uniref:galectin-2 isoform X2 n=1 Tax=Marmota monax TaxID=9995 RepID=UPI0026EF4AB6|nr:galectin-2 isoform X2 [Marmota monax]